ncbi:MAG: hypothetical protein MUE80_06825, partial [Acidobacteria bacterium]|nr:hypothetical protein [Acidobacteriota bacterium]
MDDWFASADFAAGRPGPRFRVLRREGLPAFPADLGRDGPPRPEPGRVETGAVEPERLWRLLEAHARGEALALLSGGGDEREFHTRSGPPSRVYIESIDVPGLILEAARAAKDDAALDGVLPGPGETVRRLHAGAPDAFGLSLTERYVLGLLDPPRTLAEVCGDSDAGEEATRRALFALILL